MAYEPEIFLSSATKGLEQHRAAVEERLRQAGFSTFAYELHPGTGTLLHDYLVQYLDASRLMILLLGSSYGESSPRAGNLSWTEFEWNHARKRPSYAILPFVHGGHFNTRADSCELAQREFIGRVTENSTLWKDFDVDDERIAAETVFTEVAAYYHRAFLEKDEQFRRGTEAGAAKDRNALSRAHAEISKRIMWPIVYASVAFVAFLMVMFIATTANVVRFSTSELLLSVIGAYLLFVVFVLGRYLTQAGRLVYQLTSRVDGEVNGPERSDR